MVPLDHVVQVEIFGEMYTLRAKEDPHYVRKVAHYVDSKFYETAKSAPLLPLTKLAVLTALNIADELLKHLEEEERAGAKLAELLTLLEEAVGDRDEGPVHR